MRPEAGRVEERAGVEMVAFMAAGRGESGRREGVRFADALVVALLQKASARRTPLHGGVI
jgi:hypothetical protein